MKTENVFDTARLTWLENNPNRVTWGVGRLGKPGAWFYADRAGNLQEAKSLRHAIDKAKDEKP